MGACNGFVDDIIGWNFDTDTNTFGVVPEAENPTVSHGTTVAGIIGAVGGDGINTVGVAWRVRILPIQASHDSAFTSSNAVYRDSVHNGFMYAGLMHADVVNASLGCYVTTEDKGSCSQCGEYSLSDDKYDAFTKELKAELSDIQGSLANTVVTIAAGNCARNHDASNLFAWPADMTGNNVLRVASVGAATEPNVDTLSSFSDFGTVNTDLAAPGEAFVQLSFSGSGSTTVCSSSGGSGSGMQPTDFYGCSGTSFSSPMVAGAIALVLSANPSLKGSPCALADQVLRNADPDVG
ncbi:MAG TPA: S8 family serine peptidase, partial [Kofleriaceae bacterium]|nr:S8 family serine peptidase [Kofleriaceae bacterium]